MAKKSLPKRVVKTPVLAFVGFGLGILALLPQCIMTVDFIIPQSFANTVARMSAGVQTALLFFFMFGSLPFAIASLVVGIISLRRIRRDKYLMGEKWATWAIVLGGLGLVFGVFLYFHFITSLQPTPPLPT
jgi:sterol desaturase/sphingolipid hydroxylase (fatty acid hydroxylase superfamily)